MGINPIHVLVVRLDKLRARDLSGLAIFQLATNCGFPRGDSRRKKVDRLVVTSLEDSTSDRNTSRTVRIRDDIGKMGRFRRDGYSFTKFSKWHSNLPEEQAAQVRNQIVRSMLRKDEVLFTD
jgi:hypothetical protein